MIRLYPSHTHTHISPPPQKRQIARAAAIFQVDEIVVYGDESARGNPGWGDPNLFFARLLQYMEMPQYLRKVRRVLTDACRICRSFQLLWVHTATICCPSTHPTYHALYLCNHPK